MLLHVPGVLTAALLADIQRGLAQNTEADWADGRATVGAQGAQVKHNRQLPEVGDWQRRIGALILGALEANPLFVSAALPLRFVPPLFNCYEGGEHYGAHIDGAVRPIPGTSLRLRTDLSCTLFLSDPDTYDGGELVVTDTYGTHDVKLPAGDLILYPAGSVHHVAPVTRGVRLASFFWLQSMVRDDTRRGLLFELDQTIQKLRAQLGDTGEVIALTGHYHNLMRQWAEL